MKRSRKKTKRKEEEESDDELPEREVKRRKIVTVPPKPEREVETLPQKQEPVNFWSLSEDLIGYIFSFLVESEKKRICSMSKKLSEVFYKQPSAWNNILRDFNMISKVGYNFSMDYFMKFKNIHSKFTKIFVDDLDNELLSLITANLVNVRQIFATNINLDQLSLPNLNILKEIELYWNYARNKKYPKRDKKYKDKMNLIFKIFDYKSICKYCFGLLMDDNGVICQNCDMIFCCGCVFFDKGRQDLFFIDSCSVCKGVNGSRYKRFTRYR